jgi:membrane-associated phospholipid phosphatase
MSAYKGVAVDGSLFFALHHVVTHIYLYASTCCCCCCCCCCYDADASLPKLLPAARNYLQLALYLLMRLSKRRYDTRRQLRDCAPPRITWTEAYGGYTYAQGTVALVCVCLDPLWLRPIDMIGMAAVLDSLYTCRKNGIGAQMVGERLFPAPVAALCAQRASNGAWWRVLSVADAASRWAVLPFARDWIAVATALGAFAVIDGVVKRAAPFRSLARPFRYKYAGTGGGGGGFPSAHMAMFTIVVGFGPYAPVTKAVALLGTAYYRVASYAHTIDDVFAGILFGCIAAIAAHSLF